MLAAACKRFKIPSMKRIIALSLATPAQTVLAHPGHGKPGFDHEHTLADLGVVLLLVLVVALGAWALWRFLGKRDPE